jgi:hypothetical protein
MLLLPQMLFGNLILLVPLMNPFHVSLSSLWMACYTKRVSCHGEGWKVGTWPEQENHKDEGSMEASELDNDDSIKLKLTMLMLVEGELQGYPRTTEEDGQVTPAPP